MAGGVGGERKTRSKRIEPLWLENNPRGKSRSLQEACSRSNKNKEGKEKNKKRK